jgi:asparagine synthase (glutamine-hydrolysing)
MCGIWAYIELLKGNITYLKLYQDFMAIKARGPDMSSFQTIKNVSIGFHRLAIMNPTFNANQPYIVSDSLSSERTIMFICNGEIYNFKDLISDHQLNIDDNSDCLTIPKLYIKYTRYNPNGPTCLNQFLKLFTKEIKGEYAFILFEFDKFQNLKQLVAGRDCFGVRPLYYHNPTNKSKGIIFSSEIKGMKNFEDTIQEVEPGTLVEIKFDNFANFEYVKSYDFKVIYNIKQMVSNTYDDVNILKKIRETVISSIKRRLSSDRPMAFLLSGGVDSSLIAGIASKLIGHPIRTFCCGMEAGTDLKYARKVANFIKSDHTEVIFKPEEALQKIKQVIWTTESWDTTTIRASIGQYIVCQHIGNKTDAKVIMVGEGADEVCSSYLTFWYAPSGKALHEGSVEYVKKIHMYDGRRADRNISGASCEGRVSLLDPEFVEAYWEIPEEWRMPTYKNFEKYWLRKAFDGYNIIPSDVLWRKKEAFSDGISSIEKSWFQILQDYINIQITDEEFLSLNKFGCPTKESYYYLKIFIEFFGESRINILPHYWQPKFDQNKNVVDFNDKTKYVDPSARVLQIY